MKKFVVVFLLSAVSVSCGSGSDTEIEFRTVSSFDECVEAKGEVRELSPPICVMPDGSEFQMTIES